MNPTPLLGARAGSGAGGTCPHCGTAVEGEQDAYCCGGCELAAAIIRGAGLERYYAERSAFPPRPEPERATHWRGVPVTTASDGSCETRLVVDGLRCASCVWVTEKVLQHTPGVAAATVSYATGRATIRWRPEETDLPTLAGRIAALGYRPRPLAGEATPDRDLMLRMGFAAIAAVAIMGLYEGLYAGWWYGAMDPRFAALFRWTSLVIATPVAIWCAAPFFAGAVAGLRHRVPHIDVPIALGIAILYVQGLVTTIIGQDGYLDSLAMLVALLLVGRLMESRGRRRAAEAATALAAAVPRTVRRSRENRIEIIPVEQLRAGDLIDVGRGEELAADGVIVSGSGLLRMALVTGEADPVQVAVGERVVAGAILVDGALTVWVSAVGDDTVVQQMARQVELAAERGAAPTSVDRIAPWFTILTLVVATGTLLATWWLIGLQPAIARTVAVLVVACPCALALAAPLAGASGLGAAARRGLLLRSSDSLRALATVDVVAFDKTGTVTAGALAVVAGDDATLRIAAGLERYSTHPIARAIVAEAARRGIPLPRGEHVRETPGLGIAGELDGENYRLERGEAGEVILTGAFGEAGRIRLGDVTRADAAPTVRALRAGELRVVMLSGDRSEVAQDVASHTGIAEVVAPADPAGKASWIAREQASGHRVLFAGDGLNDGPGLAAADVGIAMGTGAASSVLVADGIVSTDHLAPVLAGIRAARAMLRAVTTSQRWAVGYNVVAVGAAVLGLVNPLVAAVLMPISSGIVIWSASSVERRVRRAER